MQTASETESAAMPANFFSQRDGDNLTDDRLKSTQQRPSIDGFLFGT
jgi:hypothetical protein